MGAPQDRGPCKYGHADGRYADGRCKACYRGKSAAYRAENRAVLSAKKRVYSAAHAEQARVRHAAWRARSQDKIKAARRDYHAQNREAIVAKVQGWRAANPERLRENAVSWGAARRARERAAPGGHTAADRRAILAAQKHRCAYCRADLRRVKKHFDHITSLARGGSNLRSNIQALCAPCNLRKQAKDPVDFARETGRLI